MSNDVSKASDISKNEEKLLAQVPDPIAKRILTNTPLKIPDQPELLRKEDENNEFEKSFIRGPVLEKFKQNPLAFVGIAVTCGFLGKAIVGSAQSQSSSSINRNLRNRVKAQAFAIGAIAVAYYLSASQHDRHPRDY